MTGRVVISVLLSSVIAMAFWHKATAATCTTNAECPADQCCGHSILDILGLVQGCRAYAQEGESCHGSLLGNSCDCNAELECVEHTGLLALIHTRKGTCQQPGTKEQGLLASLIG